MPSISQGLVFTTAMVFSSTAIYLAFQWHKNTPPFQFHRNPNKQTLYSSIQGKKGVRNLKRKKKKVQFAENVMEPREKSEEMKKEQRNQNRVLSKCMHETSENIRIPDNRIALYKGILRDKVEIHRMRTSY
ncbi:hypothetical protein Lal_00025575 [Lupinus albus]|uniref:Uncharacterized protein n=1 Tax=Lupinus albus TaxID=3870 RepID=A0A6A4PVR9_LUPAL|nr:hypothetical protein Lalb_Chr10g0096781 [Lupinus albus]KAF1890242.1 hypothetical protein Lal_00025575 [Lupinus albus]